MFLLQSCSLCFSIVVHKKAFLLLLLKKIKDSCVQEKWNLGKINIFFHDRRFACYSTCLDVSVLVVTVIKIIQNLNFSSTKYGHLEGWQLHQEG